jgi:hypothetical protein
MGQAEGDEQHVNELVILTKTQKQSQAKGVSLKANQHHV